MAQTDRLTSLGTLAAGVAHEVNNPLAYILLSLDYVGMQLRKGLVVDNPEILSAIEHVRHGAERIRDIVSGLKTFSRPGSETVVMLDVARVLDTTLSMIGHELRHRGRLVKEYAAVPPVLGNEAKLGQVFLNLILNAVQSLPESRSEENEIRVVLRALAPGRVIVEIHDNGAGIDPEVRGRIFEPFFTTKPVGIGTGLGLAICHGIVTSLGGTISVESEVGKGSAFVVNLPAAAPAREVSAVASASERAASGPVTSARGYILVVDDEAIVCTSLRRLLSKVGDVVAVTTAREALGHVASGMQFDVILCDVLMPEMDAPALYDALRKIAPEQAERMVFMTGGAFTARAREFLERVPNARISKPFDIDALVGLVRSRM